MLVFFGDTIFLSRKHCKAMSYAFPCTRYIFKQKTMHDRSGRIIKMEKEGIMSNQNMGGYGIDLHFVPEQEPKGSKEKAVHTMLSLTNAILVSQNG